MNSSMEAPGEIGNTGSHPPRTKQGTSAAHWTITLKAVDSSNSSITSWVKKHCKTAVWQIEEGVESGYVHYQMQLQLNTKQRLTWLKNHFAKDCHAEITNNIAAGGGYAQKPDTRIHGPYYWPEPVQKVRDPLHGKTLFPWQQEIINIVKSEPDDRTVHWYWDDRGNTGKSALIKHLVMNYGAEFASGKKTDIAFALSEAPRIVILALPRTNEEYVSYDAIECIKDGLLFSGKYESKGKVFDPPHLFVFANFPPREEKLSADRWHIVDISESHAR